MLPEPSSLADSNVLGNNVVRAIEQRYDTSGSPRYGITPEHFQRIVGSVVIGYAGEASETEQLSLVAALHVAELALARACSAGNEAAWEVFLARFRAPLYEAAYRIAKDDAMGRELADGLYADLYGVPDSEGRRTSKLDYYMGRGSIEGWLRTVLSQQYVNRYRAQARETSLDAQIEAGATFAAPVASPVPDDRVATAVAETLTELSPEQRFLLASYYLDQRTLADMGRQLRVHESTVSRKLERLIRKLRKGVRKRLLAAGFSARRCDEVMQELNVRDLNVDVAASLRQETPVSTFYK